MESVNELLKLFMRQVRRERVALQPCGASSIDAPTTRVAPRSERRRRSDIPQDTIPKDEVHDHE